MDPYFLFLKKPEVSFEQTQRTPIFILFLFFLGLAVFFGMIVFFIQFSTGIHSIALTKIAGYSLTEKILKLVLLASVIEETLFRLLLRFNKNTVKIFFAITLSYCIYLIFKEKYMMLVVILVMQILLLFSIQLTSVNKISTFIEKHFAVIFYISVLAFGMMHLFNFEFSSSGWYYLPFLVLPQLVAGTILGYIRINYSFVHGIAFHMLINLGVLLR